MAERPIFHPDLGLFFKSLREAKGWRQSDAARFAAQRKLHALTRQVLLRLEDGKTKNPDPDVLIALARLYEWPVSAMFARFFEARYGVAIDPSKIRIGESLPAGEFIDSESDEAELLGLVRRLTEAQKAHAKALLQTIVSASHAEEGRHAISNVRSFGKRSGGKKAGNTR